MAENWRAQGHAITFVAPSGGVVTGSAYKIGQVFGIAETTQAVGENFVLLIEGVVSLPKIPTEPWSQGALIYFNPNASGGLCTSTSANLMLVGFAAASTVNPSTTGLVRLNGVGKADAWS